MVEILLHQVIEYQYVQIATEGDSVDFGDLSEQVVENLHASNGHTEGCKNPHLILY